MSSKKENSSTNSRIILEADDISYSIESVASQIKESIFKDQNLIFIGIETRGVPFSNRVLDQLGKEFKKNIEIGKLDISLYRDDIHNLDKIPTISSTKLPVDIDDKRIILFDDVLFTGRTIRAAIDSIMDYGRPSCIELAILIDRGNRELPISPTYCGKTITTKKEDHVSVSLTECDDKDSVTQS